MQTDMIVSLSVDSLSPSLSLSVFPLLLYPLPVLAPPPPPLQWMGPLWGASQHSKGILAGEGMQTIQCSDDYCSKPYTAVLMQNAPWTYSQRFWALRTELQGCDRSSSQETERGSERERKREKGEEGEKWPIPSNQVSHHTRMLKNTHSLEHAASHSTHA